MEITAKIKTIRGNTLSKIIYTSIVSLLITSAYAVYTAYLGIRYFDSFAISISIYYFLLIGIKSATIIVENKIAQSDEPMKAAARSKNYQIASIFVFMIDWCLIAPIILMVTQPKDVNMGSIPAITMATYTVYKITVAIINYARSKQSQNLTIILFREINFIDAVVSLLTLQHVLIMEYGGMDTSMRTLSLITSIAFIVLIILFSILSFWRNRRRYRG